jgi:DNA-binding beta-propeller fold protein YncE
MLLLACCITLITCGCQYEERVLASVAEYDPEKVTPKYTQILAVPTGFREDRGLTVGSAKMAYVVGDLGIRAVGNYQSPRDISKLSDTPYCIVRRPDGMLHIGQSRHIANIPDRQWEATAWKLPNDAPLLTSLAVDGEALYVADAKAKVVYCLHRADGRLLGMIGKKDPEGKVPGFVVPSPCFDVAAAGDGTVWVTNPGNRRIERYARNGKLLQTFTPSAESGGFLGCCNPAHIAVMPNGDVVTMEKGAARIRVWHPDGTLVDEVADKKALLGYTGAADIDVDHEGHIYVLNPRKHLVQVFAKTVPREAIRTSR